MNSTKGVGSSGSKSAPSYGKARLEHVLALLGYKQMNTHVIERHNGTSRLRNQRKVRKTLAFSKVPGYPRWMRWLSVGRNTSVDGMAAYTVLMIRQCSIAVQRWRPS